MSLEGGEGLRMGMDRDGLKIGYITNKEDSNTGAMIVSMTAIVKVDDVNIADQGHCTIVELLAQEGCEPIFEGVEGKNDCSEGQVCSDSDSKGVLEHLAKDNHVVSDLDIHSEKKLIGKVIKIRVSSRVVSKPSRLNS